MKCIAYALASFMFIAPCCADAAAAKAVPTAKNPVEKFDPLKSFQQLISRASEPKSYTRVYFNVRVSKWAKQFVELGEIKYDVKKTDSLVSPVVGVVKFSLSIRQSELFDSEEEASQAQEPTPKLGLQYSVEGQYAASDTAWSLGQFKYRDTAPDNPLRSTDFTFTAERLLSEKPSALGDVLKRWLP